MVQEELARYIGEMLAEMVRMAAPREGFETLAFILTMATMEAARLQKAALRQPVQ